MKVQSKCKFCSASERKAEMQKNTPVPQEFNDFHISAKRLKCKEHYRIAIKMRICTPAKSPKCKKHYGIAIILRFSCLGGGGGQPNTPNAKKHYGIAIIMRILSFKKASERPEMQKNTPVPQEFNDFHISAKSHRIFSTEQP